MENGGDDAIIDNESEDEAEIRDFAQPFFLAPLPAPEPAVRVVGLTELQDFFSNPARHLLRQGLQVTLREAEEELLDDEPFGVEWSSRRALAQRLLPALQVGATDEQILALAAAGREYPAGALGKSLLLRELPALRHYAARVPVARCGPPIWSVSARFEVAGEGLSVILEDTLVGFEACGQICHRYASPTARDKLETWLSHLFFNAADIAGPIDPPRRTRWLGREPGFEFSPCPEAKKLLHALLALYAQGLRLPLRFAPRAALTYVEELPKGRARALREARRIWVGQGDPGAAWGRLGEGDSPAWRIALRHEPQPLNADFEQAACTVFEPLLAHLSEET